VNNRNQVMFFSLLPISCRSISSQPWLVLECFLTPSPSITAFKEQVVWSCLVAPTISLFKFRTISLIFRVARGERMLVLFFPPSSALQAEESSPDFSPPPL